MASVKHHLESVESRAKRTKFASSSSSSSSSSDAGYSSSDSCSAGSAVFRGIKATNRKEIHEEMENAARCVAIDCDLTPAQATVVLSNAQWREQSVRKTLFRASATRKARYLLDRGLRAPAYSKNELPDWVTCLIMGDVVSRRDAWSLPCEHVACKECWRDHCRAVVNRRRLDGSPVSVHCIQDKCKLVLDRDALLLLADPETAALYQALELRDYIASCAQTLKQCPNPVGCPNFAKLRGGSAEVTVHCVCGFSWCFACYAEDHRPCSCKMVSKWASSDKGPRDTPETRLLASEKWILANTKRCPLCKVPIEKNRGCMHMTCRNPGCGFQFCWLCLGEWSSHGRDTGGSYACTIYEANQAQYGPQKLNSSTDVYTKFSNLVHLQMAGTRYAQEILADSGQRRDLAICVEGDDYLGKAIDAVIACRKRLRWAYVYGYYLTIQNEKHQQDSVRTQLFELQARMLREKAEVLTELLELDISTICRQRVQIVALTTALTGFLDKLMEHYNYNIVFCD